MTWMQDLKEYLGSLLSALNWEELSSLSRAERASRETLTNQRNGHHQLWKVQQGKCWILHVGRGKPGCVDGLGNEAESSCRKGLGSPGPWQVEHESARPGTRKDICVLGH